MPTPTKEGLAEMMPEIRHAGVVPTAPHRRFFPMPALAPTKERRGWLYPGEPETCRRDYVHFLPVLGHLAMMLALYRVYNVEGRGFLTLAAIAAVALPIHYMLPFRWKKPFFVAISILGMGWIFGTYTALAVLAASAVLIGVCYLRVRWEVRAGLVAAIPVGFAVLRPESMSASLPNNVWPLLGTMFMFRMIVYLYELKHAKAPESLVDTLGYFFLLPNYAFLHFPVVDYRTQQRCYFSKDVHETQRAGLQMMFRGAVHLLLYRLVYHELLISADEVHNLASLAGYLTCNYLLYLRVSGQFHTACGMLHLFGFHLPETHRNYLLATGFTDYWRRINIYWKDFMVRVVFNPVVFSLKRRPQPIALAAATAVVFVTTWGLHAYQSYWLRGEWSFSTPDGLFWGVLGVLVMINVQLDARRSAARPVKVGSPTVPETPRQAAFRVAGMVGMGLTIAILAVGIVGGVAAASRSISQAGRTGFSASDALVLVVLGAFALVSAWSALNRTEPKAAKAEHLVPRRLALKVTKTVWTFATIALLWSLWTSPSVGSWVSMLKRGMTL
jgi:alginate O-acetyltransferase complex protein AlgI